MNALEVEGGPYSIIVAYGKQDGNLVRMFALKDMDHMQSAILSAILRLITEDKMQDKIKIEMAPSEINNCIVQEMLGKRTPYEFCLTKSTITFDLQKKTDAAKNVYIFRYRSVETGFEQSNTLLHYKIEHATHAWLKKILEKSGIVFEDSIDNDDKSRDQVLQEKTRFVRFEFPQENMKDFRDASNIMLIRTWRLRSTFSTSQYARDAQNDEEWSE